MGKTAVAKTTATKTTIAKIPATKTVKKPLSLKAQAAKRALVKRNRKAGSKKASLAQKKKGIGLFAPVNLSAELAAICGGKKMPRTQVTKKLWEYIKAKKLNEGRIIKPDGPLKAIFPVAKLDMLKLPSFVGKHLSK